MFCTAFTHGHAHFPPLPTVGETNERKEER
jgi:hypothetical protein